MCSVWSMICQRSCLSDLLYEMSLSQPVDSVTFRRKVTQSTGWLSDLSPKVTQSTGWLSDLSLKGHWPFVFAGSFSCLVITTLPTKNKSKHKTKNIKMTFRAKMQKTCVISRKVTESTGWLSDLSPKGHWLKKISVTFRRKVAESTGWLGDLSSKCQWPLSERSLSQPLWQLWLT